MQLEISYLNFFFLYLLQPCINEDGQILPPTNKSTSVILEEGGPSLHTSAALSPVRYLYEYVFLIYLGITKPKLETFLRCMHHEVVFYEFYAFIFVREGEEQENKNHIKYLIQEYGTVNTGAHVESRKAN
jgi:hypothetical protein